MKPNPLNLLLVIGVLLIIGFGCKTMTEGKPAAEKAITKFHQMLAEEKYPEIYANSAKLMKEAATEEDMVKLFKVVNSKLGRVKSTTTQSWQVGNYNLISTVTLNQKTEFEKGEGSEQFVFVVDGDDAKLAGYHINSMDLISE